jgi:acylglycerol lipase
VQYDESFAESADGTRLFLRTPRISEPVQAEVLLTHGLGEHSGRYGHVADAMASRGLRLWMYDLRGHGRSAGRRGDVEDYESLLCDLDVALERVQAGSAERPVFLMGHSLGGQITLNYLLGEKGSACAGAVVASPWLRLAFAPARWRVALARLAAKICPGLRQPTPHEWERLSRDLDHLQAMPDLDLCHHRISARFYLAVEQAGLAALAGAPRLQLPLLLLHGGDDRVTCAKATSELHARAGAADKTLAIYPEARHETHNDLCRDRVIADIIGWFEARARTAAGRS